MKKQNKDKAPVTEHDDMTFDEDCKFLIEALSEDSQSRMDQNFDPFENYVQRVSSKIHLEPGKFRERFVKGYQALIEELKHG